MHQDASMTTAFDPEQIIEQVSTKLIDKYPDADAATIREIVSHDVKTFESRPVKDYVAVLSERTATAQIKVIAQSA
jgi:hypothetical protein